MYMFYARNLKVSWLIAARSKMNSTLGLCGPNPDNYFGPQVKGCPGIFDFTLLFEQTILSIVPSSMLLLAFPLRLALLNRRNFETRRNSLVQVKAGSHSQPL
jgi:hypothetical protein